MTPMHPHHEHGRRFARGGSGGYRHDSDRDHADGHGHDGRGRGGRRSTRLFDHGELRLVVLDLIAERPRQGYEIIKEIEDRVATTYSPSAGVIYPTLIMLEQIGHATVAERDGKKLYAITPDGAAYVAAHRVALDGVLERMRSVNDPNSGGPAPEIVRATEKLRLALRLRQGRGPSTTEQVQATAAVAIERS